MQFLFIGSSILQCHAAFLKKKKVLSVSLGRHRCRFGGLLFEMSSVSTCTAPIRYLTLKVVSPDGTEDIFVQNSYITVPINYQCVTPGTSIPFLGLMAYSLWREPRRGQEPGTNCLHEIVWILSHYT